MWWTLTSRYVKREYSHNDELIAVYRCTAQKTSAWSIFLSFLCTLQPILNVRNIRFFQVL